MKDGYKVKLKTAKEAIQIFGSTKKLISKIRNGENLATFEVVEIVLCNEI